MLPYKRRTVGLFQPEFTMDDAEPLPKRRRSYSVQEKIQYLRDFETALLNGTVTSLTELAASYDISLYTMRRWDLQTLERQAGEGRGKDRTVKDRHVGHLICYKKIPIECLLKG